VIALRNQEIVAFPNDLLEPEADCAAKQFFKEIALSADAVVIMHVLRDAVRGSGLDEGVGENPISRVEGRDVCVARNVFSIPRPIDEDHDPFHGRTSPPKRTRRRGEPYQERSDRAGEPSEPRFSLRLEFATVQKRLLLWRRGPPEGSIAVRKPAEAADDVGMQFCPPDELCVARAEEKRNAALLIC
jgi:hypothetical protein